MFACACVRASVCGKALYSYLIKKCTVSQLHCIMSGLEDGVGEEN